MSNEFKTIEFDCKFKMQVKIDDNMTNEEIVNQIQNNFEMVMEYGSSSCDESDEYSAYMVLDDIKNIKSLKE
jgi:hypothetical protein